MDDIMKKCLNYKLHAHCIILVVKSDEGWSQGQVKFYTKLDWMEGGGNDPGQDAELTLVILIQK